MKREHIIQKLVDAGIADPRILRNSRNEDLEKKLHKLNRELEDKRRSDLQIRLSVKWSENWVHPKVRYPLRRPTDEELVALVLKNVNENRRRV